MAAIHRKRLRTGRVVWELTHGRGENRVRFVAGQTKEEAEGVLAQFNQQLRMHGTAPQDITVSEAVKKYREYLVLNRRERTVTRYRRVLDTFAVCFLQTYHPDIERLRDIKPLHVEDYKRRRSAGEISEQKTAPDEAREQQLRSELARNPKRRTMKANAKYGWLGRHTVHSRVSVRTINYELRCLFTFFRWAIKQNFLFVNPVANIEKFRVPKRSLPRFMTSEELRKFFAACREDERRLFSAILLTGMRKGEIEYLTWNDLNFDLGIVFIQAKPEVGWQPKTDERVIPISPTVQQLLFEQYANRTSDQWAFANSAGQRDGHILEKLKSVCRRAGIKPATVRPATQFRRSPADARRQPRGHRGLARSQGPRDDADLREGAAGAPAIGHRQADRLGAGRHKIERCVTQTRHSGGADPERRPETPDRRRLGGRGRWDGGERGIRTLGRVSPTHAFQACSFNHSDISPFRINHLQPLGERGF